ncbi:MAG: NAD(P)/FAD-dependent oxidoreductase [Lachnospiraceae bacterium]|nr:NAD(P)/FAD-dependent oxidoreductase [Lachnospiraceae bacterium]
MRKVLVIGGGASGMMAAISAAENGASAEIFEKNEKLGKKLYITGKGRCNVTNACGDPEQFLGHMVHGKNFMYSSFYSFTNTDMMDYLEGLGLRLKTERGQRVYPASDKASDVIRALSGRLSELEVKVHLNTEVSRIMVSDGACTGILLSDGRTVKADAVILAAGGLSYPATGSTGDGYRMAGELGHSVTRLYPSLVSLKSPDAFCRELTGLSLRNISMTLKSGKKKVYSGFGEMLFTHQGISGPLVLTASTLVHKFGSGELKVYIDLKPALDEETLDARILRDFESATNKHIKNALGALLPASIIPVVIKKAGIDPDKYVHDITKEERRVLLHTVKSFEININGTGDFSEAVITQGGAETREIEPSSMESKKVRGLFFAGEVIDIDAETGGYNLQAAWSTGRAAGIAAAEG